MWQLETVLRKMVICEDSSCDQQTQDLTKAMIPTRYRNPVARSLIVMADIFEERWKKMWVTTLLIVLNLSLFTWKALEYHKAKAYEITGICVCIAKGAGETLKLNMAIVLFPVCRRTITKLRSTFLGKFFPFDDNLNFHKFLAFAIAIGTIVHTLAHMACGYPRLARCPKRKFDDLYGPVFNYKQPGYLGLLATIPSITGLIMVFIMAITYTFATDSFRKVTKRFPKPFHHLGGFNTFWYTHHLLFLVYVLFIIHGSFLISQLEWHQKTVCLLVLIEFPSNYTSSFCTFPS